jgi:16S rRNA processing protein RimM
MAGVGSLWACGVLGRAHGLGGELYLDLLPNGAEYLSRGMRFYIVGEGAEQPVEVHAQRTGGHDRRPLVRLDAAASREEALVLQGATLLAAGGDLDELPHYNVSDLVGMPVAYEGRRLGTVTDVLSAPAQEILEIRSDGGATNLVPLVDDLVTVDVARRLVTVRSGLLDAGS